VVHRVGLDNTLVEKAVTLVLLVVRVLVEAVVQLL
jgi:hypothetical protein